MNECSYEEPKSKCEMALGKIISGSFNKDDIDLITSLFTTPPTAEEVCKALSEYLKLPVEYNKDIGMFSQLENTGITVKYCVPRLVDVTWLPPRLITMIGQFYEKMEN